MLSKYWVDKNGKRSLLGKIPRYLKKWRVILGIKGTVP
jgi:hypothetical protein